MARTDCNTARPNAASLLAALFVCASALSVVALPLATPAYAGPTVTLHVKLTGSDAGNTTCTNSAPCATIGNALPVGASWYDKGYTVTIAVGPGTFNESQLSLARPVTIKGAGAGSTTVNVNSANPSCATVNLIQSEAVVIGPDCGLNAATDQVAGIYALEDVTLEGIAGLTSSPAKNQPLLVNASALDPGLSLTLSNDTFVSNATIDPNNVADYPIGVYMYGGGPTSNVSLTHDSFTGQFNPVYVRNNEGNVTVFKDSFSSEVSGFDPANGDTQTEPAEAVELIAEGSSPGYFGPMTGHYSVTDNIFSGFSGWGVRVRAGYGFVGRTGIVENVTVSHNTFAVPVSPYSQSIGTTTAVVDLEADTNGGNTLSNVVIASNSITSSGTGAIDVRVAVAPTGGNPPNTVSNITVEGNNRILGGNGVIGVDNTGSAVNATHNFWGCASGPGNSGLHDHRGECHHESL